MNTGEIMAQMWEDKCSKPEMEQLLEMLGEKPPYKPISCSAAQILSPTGSVPDPLTGGGCIPKGVWTQVDQMNHLCSEQSSTLPLTSSSAQMPAWMYKTLQNVPETSSKPKSGAAAHLSGSHKPKGIRKDIFKNGIL